MSLFIIMFQIVSLFQEVDKDIPEKQCQIHWQFLTSFYCHAEYSISWAEYFWYSEDRQGKLYAETIKRKPAQGGQRRKNKLFF